MNGNEDDKISPKDRSNNWGYTDTSPFRGQQTGTTPMSE